MQAYAIPRLTESEGRAYWREMLDDVNASQLATPSWPSFFLKLITLTFLLSIGLYFAWMQSSFILLCVAYVVIALVLAQFAFVGHDAGHGSISCHKGVNRIVGQICMTLIAGLAYDEWIGRHRAHHKYCQDEERDPDMEVNFVVSLTAKSKQQKGKLGRFITRYQAKHIWLISFLFGHSQRHLSQLSALRYPVKYSLDTAMLVLHFLFWFGLPCLIFDVSIQAAALAYIIPLTVLGPYLAGIFWVNHIGMPLIDTVEKFSFLEHQAVTSRTIINPPGWNWVFGGLNFQVEHHLFPQVPSNNLGAVQAIVKKHFVRHGIEYNDATWWRAVALIESHLRKVAVVS